MANAFSKEEIVLFEQVLEQFDPNNITARQVTKFKPPSTSFERSALTVFRPVPYISITNRGLTLATAQFSDTTQLAVPSSLNASDDPTNSDIINVPFVMNAVELNDPLQRDRKATSAVQALSAKVDTLVATEVAEKGSLFVAQSAAITTYGQVAKAEEVMSIRDVPIMSARTLIMNPADYNGVAGNLANRDAPPTGVSLTAFERSRIPTVATFDSFKANFQPTQGAFNAGAASYVTNGTANAYTPVATDANGNNVDNRFQTLNIKTGSVALKKGDAFSIAGINAIGLINKNDTGTLQTFRVVETTGTSAPTVVITPPIIPKDGTAQSQKEYANVTTAPADGTALIFLNSVAVPSNVFFANESVEIVHGSLATMDLDGAGVATMRQSTDSGIEILFAKSSNINNLGTQYRLTMWTRPNVLIPDMCGNLVGNQT